MYNYAPMKLWLPYGIALAVTLLDVLIGFWAMFSLGTAYTANFSTIFRIAKNAYVRANTQEHGLAGKDPLPEELAKAAFVIKTADAFSQIEDTVYVKVKQVEERDCGSMGS